MSVEYEYDEVAAVKADASASRITEGGPYVGVFKKVWAIEAESGAKGVSFVFDSPGNGTVEFSLYTIGKEGQQIVGYNFLSAIQFMTGVKSLKSVPGTAEVWDADAGKRVEVEVDEFPALCDKPVGLFFQRELSTYNNKTSDRLGLEAVFQPETKLFLSEIKERKTVPVKYDRMVKICAKVKDKRKAVAAEPGQPGVGASGVDTDGY